MSRHDYLVAKELARNPKVTFTSLIMAALAKASWNEYPRIRDTFREIGHEYWDRRCGIRGYLRGEDREADAEYAVLDREAETIDMGIFGSKNPNTGHDKACQCKSCSGLKGYDNITKGSKKSTKNKK